MFWLRWHTFVEMDSAAAAAADSGLQFCPVPREHPARCLSASLAKSRGAASRPPPTRTSARLHWLNIAAAPRHPFAVTLSHPGCIPDCIRAASACIRGAIRGRGRVAIEALAPPPRLRLQSPARTSFAAALSVSGRRRDGGGFERALRSGNGGELLPARSRYFDLGRGGGQSALLFLEMAANINYPSPYPKSPL